MQRNEPGLRACWVQIHLWLGLTLGVLGMLIGISGSLLVLITTSTPFSIRIVTRFPDRRSRCPFPTI